MSPVAQIPFGPGLDKETGAMVVSPNRMQDLRNVYHHEGSLVVRSGVEKTVDFVDYTSGADATHVLMGVALRSENAGIVVTFEQSSRRVTVHRVDALGTTATALGHWEHRPGVTAWPGTDIPKVILEEIYGTVYMAHDEFFVGRRADTFVYDPFFEAADDVLAPLRGLLTQPHDLSPEETHVHPAAEEIRFRGVSRHLDYLFGWGWGNSGPEGIRPEMVRASFPGEPRSFDPDHYFIAGDRRDPVIACEPARHSLLVAKQTETHQIIGTSRATFGIRPYDLRYGCLGGRLMVSVAGSVYSWSAQGPMVGTDRGPWQKIWLPLDLGGFEPATLVQRIEFKEGWADFIDEIEHVIFGFGRRTYNLSIRNPEDPRWTYWELGRKAFCGFRLFGRESGDVEGTATIQTITVGDNDVPCGPQLLFVNVANSGQTGEEFIEVWYRAQGPILGSNPTNRMTDGFNLDADDDGVPDNWTEDDSTSGGNATFSLDTTSGGAAARIQVTGDSGATGSSQAELRWRDNSVVVGKHYRLEAEVETRNASHLEGTGIYVGETQIEVEFFDSGGIPLGTVTEEVVSHDFTKFFIDAGAAPASTAYGEIVLRVKQPIVSSELDSLFRNVKFYELLDATEWKKAPIGEPGVAVSPEATQLLPPFAVDEPGTQVDVAVRYVSAAGVPLAEADDADPTNWPAGSNLSESVTMQAPAIHDWSVHWSDNLGPYVEFRLGCNDGGADSPPRYSNRDFRVRKDATTYFTVCRGRTTFRRYLNGPAGVSEVAQEFNAWTARYNGPDSNSDYGPAIDAWPGPYEFARPLIVNADSTATDQWEADFQRVQTVTPEGLQHDDMTIIGIEIQDDAPAGSGTFVQRFYPSGTEYVPSSSPFTHTEAGAGGKTITVRARHIYHPAGIAGEGWPIVALHHVYGPWQTVTIDVSA